MEYKRTKIGQFMFNITNKGSLFFARHKVLFYISTYTWGLLFTLIGWVMYGFVAIFLRKKIVEKGKFFTARYMIFGNNWGGLEAGPNFLIADKMGEDYTLHTKCHELGHTYQNALWGPFTIFMISIPSVVRYWYQRIRDLKGKPNKPYDAIFFEKSASYIGETLLSEQKNKDYYYYTEDFKKNPNYGLPLQKEEK